MDYTQQPATEASITPSEMIPVDPEPVQMRLMLLAMTFLILIGTYILINQIIPGDGINLLAFIGSILGVALLLPLIEKYLKASWKATRFVQISPESIDLITRGSSEARLNPIQQINVTLWYFEVRKRTRVPKGWHVVACLLEQDETYIAVYTLASPQDFYNLRRSFSKLEYTRPTETRDLRLAGQQRRLQTAESIRAAEGVEMNLADFEIYLTRLESYFPKWMPSTRA